MTKPGVLLLEAMRAVQAGDRLIVHAASRLDAERALSIIDRPWRRRTDHGVTLYNTPAPVRVGQLGEFIVHADDEQPPEWHLGADRIELRDGSTVVAAGEPTASVTSLDYDLPRVSPANPNDPDTSLLVRSVEGTVLDEFDDAKSVLDDWRPVRVPAVPSRLAFDAVDVAYFDENDEVQFRVLNDELPLEVVADQFRAAYTVRRAGAELDVEELIDRFRSWYDARSNGSTPSTAVAARALLQGSDEIRRRVDNGSKTRVLTDRDWIIPRGLESPDLPL